MERAAGQRCPPCFQLVLLLEESVLSWAPWTKRAASMVAAAVLLAGCSPTAAPTPQIIYVTPEPAASEAVTPEPAASEAVVVTPEPTTEVVVEEATEEPSPEGAGGSANVQLQKIHLIKWKNAIDNWEYQIVAEVKNTGTGWADTYASSDFTILAKDGSVTDTDTAYFGVPRFLAPGASGYLLGESQIDGGSSSDIARVEIEPTWNEADGPLAAMEPSKVKMKSGYYGDGVDVTGLIKNTGTDRADAYVFTILVGSGGKILGYNSTSVDGIGAGKSKGFVAAGDRDLKKSLVKKVMVYAFDSAS